MAKRRNRIGKNTSSKAAVSSRSKLGLDFTPTPLPAPLAYHQITGIDDEEETGCREQARQTSPNAASVFRRFAEASVTNAIPKVYEDDSALTVPIDEQELEERPTGEMLRSASQLVGAQDDTRVEEECRDTFDCTELAATVTSHDRLTVIRAFERSFAKTLQSLAPDGSAIDAPLTVFADLPDPILEKMAAKMVLRSFAAGETILEEGQLGDSCYVIISGEVRVLKRDPSGGAGLPIEVARLGDGGLFGEFGALSDRRRHATVQAVGPCRIYEIPRSLLREMADKHPNVRPVLNNYYRERLLATLLVTAPFFRTQPEDRRGQLLSLFEPRWSEAGEILMEEGKPSPGFHLVIRGSVEIRKRRMPGKSVSVARDGEGTYFGEISLLCGTHAVATVVTTSHTELAVLRPKEFYETLSAQPKLWLDMKADAEVRMQNMQRDLVK